MLSLYCKKKEVTSSPTATRELAVTVDSRRESLLATFGFGRFEGVDWKGFFSPLRCCNFSTKVFMLFGTSTWDSLCFAILSICVSRCDQHM